MQPILLKNADNPDSAGIDEYLKIGGYRALEKALGMSPAEVVEEVTADDSAVTEEAEVETPAEAEQAPAADA